MWEGMWQKMKSQGKEALDHVRPCLDFILNVIGRLWTGRKTALAAAKRTDIRGRRESRDTKQEALKDMRLFNCPWWFRSASERRNLRSFLRISRNMINLGKGVRKVFQTAGRTCTSYDLNRSINCMVYLKIGEGSDIALRGSWAELWEMKPQRPCCTWKASGIMLRSLCCISKVDGEIMKGCK